MTDRIEDSVEEAMMESDAIVEETDPIEEA
jgi:hypothetical protein